jgi:hypothetical protein
VSSEVFVCFQKAAETTDWAEVWGHGCQQTKKYLCFGLAAEGGKSKK